MTNRVWELRHLVLCQHHYNRAPLALEEILTGLLDGNPSSVPSDGKVYWNNGL